MPEFGHGVRGRLSISICPLDLIVPALGLSFGPRAKITLVGGVVIVVVVLAWIVASYNSIVTKDQAVMAQWAQVENQYQRKIDLIPTLVITVGQYT